MALVAVLASKGSDCRSTKKTKAAKGAMMNQRIDRSPEGGFLVRTNGATQTFGSIGEIIEVFKSSWNLKA